MKGCEHSSRLTSRPGIGSGSSPSSSPTPVTIRRGVHDTGSRTRERGRGGRQGRSRLDLPREACDAMPQLPDPRSGPRSRRAAGVAPFPRRPPRTSLSSRQGGPQGTRSCGDLQAGQDCWEPARLMGAVALPAASARYWAGDVAGERGDRAAGSEAFQAGLVSGRSRRGLRLRDPRARCRMDTGSKHTRPPARLPRAGGFR